MDNSSRCSNSTLPTTSSLTTCCSGSSTQALVRNNSRSTIIVRNNKGIKANHNTKYRAKGVGSSRWRAAAGVRRDSSLTTLQLVRKPSRNVVTSTLSLASNLGRGLAGLRLVGSLGNLRNAIFKNTTDKCGVKHSNNKSRHTGIGSIQNVALQQALHREIECHQIMAPHDSNNNAAAAEHSTVFVVCQQQPLLLTPGHDRWSEKQGSSSSRSDNNRRNTLGPAERVGSSTHTQSSSANMMISQGTDRGSKNNSSSDTSRRDHPEVLFKPPTRKQSNNNLYF